MLVGRVKAACLPALLVAQAASAHVAPSRDVNNRYLKATLLPGSVRLTFTLLWGELPGGAERRRMDGDGDGQLSAEESRRFGDRIAAELAPRLLVTVDGQPAPGWRLIDVGLGAPRTDGGSFAVDLELQAPYPDPAAAEHRLTIDDTAALPYAGEVELRIDESPGVRLVESHVVRERSGIETTFTFTGNASAPGDRAVEARFTVDASLRARGPVRRRSIFFGAGGAAAIIVAVVALRRRRRRRAAT